MYAVANYLLNFNKLLNVFDDNNFTHCIDELCRQKTTNNITVDNK